ncbi:MULTISPECIES: LPXTG cell wall anchor domain-containing protein [unclassified Streptococcus]|uniref:LPXTG cell wall anchor domain-containing protein n=1 Tax=unclassified Streptococcus TaxID=2608887 RepID=UPI0010727873|nr:MULTISPECIES: LPXTG cell wall anchor domain-containing protein [unclassified Streptococcus]MBF0786585.1 LPXTG cell wall anchor domain-containing protein [Streptococcus sp. 19428wC2_LYSM12]MCQ9210922.1 LPXTG cell wall anchor domain-containing protein [Streptococcus sp. B01]MCQ9214191.1 LPXTG cell wall anchor domain-containing protein [Streptococcus sp. O1]TFV06548.1 LPXTG cell wall anchor domain-containing protein [Streptococcus sp. LYSM12]
MKKNKMTKTLLQAGLALSLLGGSTLPVFATLPVAAETVQVKSYELTAEEKAGIEEYVHAKLRVDMQEFYETVLKGMWDTARETATKVWDEENAEIESGLTPEQIAVLKGIQQSLINSIATHYHYLWTMHVAVNGYGIQEAKDTIAKYEEGEEEELAPEVELAVLKYMKELILDVLAKNKAVLADYEQYATEVENQFKELFLQETIDLEALNIKTIQYGQALATASQPEFPYDFTEMDQRIEELTRQLEPKEPATSGIENSTPTPGTGRQGGLESEASGQPDGVGEIEPPKVVPTGESVKILPKTSSTQGLMMTLFGFFMASIGTLLIAKRKI